jgi:hypothetical protein
LLRKDFAELSQELALVENPSFDSIINALVHAVERQSGKAQVQAIEAIGRLPSYCSPRAHHLLGTFFQDLVKSEPILEVLIPLTGSQNPDLVAAAFKACGSFADQTHELFLSKVGCDVLNWPDEAANTQAKIEVVKLLWKWGPDTASMAVPILGHLLSQSDDDLLRTEIARALQWHETEARPVVAAILTAMIDERASEELRCEAGLALLACEPRDDDFKGLSPGTQARVLDRLRIVGMTRTTVNKSGIRCSVGHLATNLRRRLQEFWKNPQPPARSPKRKRSTQPGEAGEKILAALVAWHRPEGDSCLKWTPLGVNELATSEHADVSSGSVTNFFNQHFGREGKDGHARYKKLCMDNNLDLPHELLALRNELPCRHHFGSDPLAPRLDGRRRGGGKSSNASE